ncbi:hypothetical protein LEP1GSC166_0389 [Leptospira kirschneri]|nr:hypothetical protein LEP1GSC166_0389 [Leptospira kirschneri]
MSGKNKKKYLFKNLLRFYTTLEISFRKTILYFQKNKKI